MLVVETKKVRKSYDRQLVLDDVNFEMYSGKCYGLLGPNGAGKSTFVSILLNLVKADEGQISLFQEDISQIQAIRDKIGYVPQEIAVYPDLTAFENVKLFGMLYGLKGKQLIERINDSLQKVGLLEKARKFPKHFSGGMQRRLNIACALVHQPQLIILDEPTVGIDPQSRNMILETIEQLKKQGTSILYISHYMEEIEKVCDYVYVMDQGKVIEKGAVDRIIQKYRETLDEPVTIWLQDSEIIYQIEWLREKEYSIVDGKVGISVKEKQLNEMLRLLAKEEVVILEISREYVNLEVIFLYLTGKALRDE